jgi:hypothetical protein
MNIVVTRGISVKMSEQCMNAKKMNHSVHPRSKLIRAFQTNRGDKKKSHRLVSRLFDAKFPPPLIIIIVFIMTRDGGFVKGGKPGNKKKFLIGTEKEIQKIIDCRAKKRRFFKGGVFSKATK